MGQIVQPAAPGLLYTSLDRVTAPNAAQGMAVGASHVVVIGENAGQNLSQNDVIFIGREVMKNTTSADQSGTVVIGQNSFGTAANLTTDKALTFGALVNVGSFNAPNVVATNRIAGCVFVGTGIWNAFVGNTGVGNNSRNVFVGNGVAQLCTLTAQNCSDNVFIGHQAARGGAGSGILNSVIIGSAAGTQADTQGGSNQVIIGRQAGNAVTTAAGNVIIGHQAGQSVTTGGANVIIGSSASTQGTGCVIIGDNNAQFSLNNAVVIGTSPFGWSSTSNGIIAIGNGVGTSGVAGVNRLIIENNIAAVRQAWIYGTAGGDIVLGNSANTDRDLASTGGTNRLKLINGTPGGSAPANGGYFYVVAGALHWVGSGGTDTVVAPA